MVQVLYKQIWEVFLEMTDWAPGEVVETQQGSMVEGKCRGCLNTKRGEF